MSKILQVKFFIIILSVLAFFDKAEATHSMGADLTYQCVGGNKYKIRVSFYRDCIGIAAPVNVNVSIKSASCGQSFNQTLNPIPGTGQQISPLCPSALSTCNGGIFTGIQEWIYEGIVTLPMQCTDWVFSYNLCCRNNAINTITNPTSSTFYIYATLNNTIVTCNNSPVFSNKPVPFACLGQQFCFNHGASDVDGDSLVYQLITPKETATNNVNYIAPFSATNPLTSNPAVQFNNATGDICMTPQALDVTVMAVLVKEYRNGQLIGSVERDIQVTVINCNNNLPTLTGINGTNQFSATICANQPYCFNIYSNDLDVGQQVSLSYDSAISNASFTSAGSPHPTGTFCWTPTNADIGQPHCFTVRVFDDACPWIGSQIYSYCLTVKGVNVNAGPDQLITCSDLATLTANASGGTGGPYTYLWSNGFTNPTQTVGPGTYVVTVSDGLCSNSDTVVVSYLSLPTANFSASPVCLNSPIPFQDLSTVSGSIIIDWYWTFGDGTSSTLQNPTHIYTTVGTYNVSLVVSTNLGCMDTITIPITINPLPVPLFTVAPTCAGSVVSIVNTTSGSITGWNWNFGNGTTSTQQNPTISYADTGTYTITLNVTDNNGCLGTVVQQVTIEPTPIAAFNISGLNACQGGSVTFTNTSSGNISSYNWNFGNGQTSNQQNPTILFPTAGTFPVTLTVTSATGCVSTVVQNIIISPPPTVSAGLNTAVCIGQAVTLTATGGLTYQWSTGQSTNPISVNPASATTYTVTATDANGCTASNTVLVSVNPLPVISLTPDQTICLGQSAILTAGGGITYFWNPTGSSSSAITVSPVSSTTYSVAVTNANGCTNNGFVNVIVRPNPVVTIPSTFVCSGTSTVLNAGNAGSTYQWSTGEITPTIAVTTPGNYTVTVTNSFGCTASQVVLVTSGGSITNNNSNLAICQGGTATLDAGNPGNTYLWSTGATTQAITASIAGQYAVTITNSNGCTATLTTTLNVNPLPVAGFTPHDVCLNEPVNFNDISSIGTGSITSWLWSFGDGNVSQQQNPSHGYALAGSYNIQLTTTSNAGCVDTVSQTVNVYPLPTVDFTMVNGCANSSIHFTNLSSTSAGNILSYNWNFNDGTTSSLPSPNHIFLQPGTYNVTLVVGSSGGCVDSIKKQVTIYARPQADFAAPAVCKGLSTSFSNLSSVSGNNINAWNWDFGNGLTSVQQNPVITYANAGTFNAQLIVQTAYGCSDTIIKPVRVHALPNADAGPNQSVCLGTSVSLIATGGINYQWQPLNLNTASVNVSPLVSTMYYVAVSDSNGCSAMDSVNVNIRPLPVANAGADKIICTNENVNLVASGGISYMWQPTNQTTASITVSPSVTTSYVVTVTAANGCTATDTVAVNVNALPVANAGPDKTICNGDIIPIVATGGITYQWLPTGDSTATIYVNPSLTTSYVVLVTDANGCQNRDTIVVNVNASPVVNVSDAFFCIGFNTTLNAGNAGSTFEWMPNGETTQSIQVSTAGTYGVIVTAPNGCTAFDEAIVTIGGDSLVDNSTNVMICQGETATLNAGNPGATYQWSTGATSQSINVSSSGVYSVLITDPSGCHSLSESIVTVNPLPVPQFSASPLCLGNPTIFNNQSTIAAGTILSYVWQFGDSAISNVPQPVHTYALPGTYSITLQTTSANGCTATAMNQVTINPLPVLNIAAQNACQHSTMLFSNTSSVAGSTISNWLWNFGDGLSSTAQNVTHSYANYGNFPVTLIATSAQGCSDSSTIQVTVHPVPQLDFSVSNVCQGSISSFQNLSSLASGAIQAFSWNFGNGDSASGTNSSLVYTTPGVFQVTLQAVSDSGCTATFTRDVIVYPNPLASFTIPAVCQYNMASVQNLTTLSSGTISNWYWNFGDGFSTNDSLPQHQFAQAGIYPIQLIVTSDMGCSDTAVFPLTIFDVPVAAFTGNGVCLNSSIQFRDASTVANATINSWNWQFSNGYSSAQQNPVVSFTTAGVATAQLIVSSSDGCLDTVSHSINVYDLPVPAFTSANVCLGNPTNFYNQTFVNGGATFNCLWNFGDGSTDTLEYSSHTYVQPGNYTVQLYVTTNTGCVANISQPVIVYAPPVARFTADNVCKNQQTFFNDSSMAPNGLIASWNWTFGDGGTSQSKNPLHTYATDGLFPVELKVLSNYGCPDQYLDSVEVFRLPNPQIFTIPNCTGIPISMVDVSDTTHNVTTSWSWNFGDGHTSSLASPSHAYAAPGNYWITLLTQNNNGCLSLDSARVESYPIPHAAFSGGPGCDGAPVTFQNNSSISSGVIAFYNWSFGDSTGSSTANPVHTYSPPGNYNVTLLATSDQGCVDSTQSVITIHANPVSSFTMNQHAGCGPLPIQFYDHSQLTDGYINQWQWNFGDGHADTLQNPLNVYTQTGVYNVTLTVTSNYGCVHTDTLLNSITVYPSPLAAFTPDPQETTILHPDISFINQTTGGNSYSWTFGDGYTSNAFAPSHAYGDTGRYDVGLITINTFGCRDTAFSWIYIAPITTFYIPNAFTPNNDGSNEIFDIKGINILNYTLSIRDRWGELIFQGENRGWDGHVKGGDICAKQDVYVYSVIAKDVFGKQHKLVGHVTLLR
jgi:gliding motility-associated-like protein